MPYNSFTRSTRLAIGSILSRLSRVCLQVSAQQSEQKQPDATEQHFRELWEAVPQIVWIENPAGQVEYYNRMWYQITGLPASSIPHLQDRRSVISPEDWDNWLRIWSKAIASGESYESEYRLWDESRGEYRWYLRRGVPAKDSSGSVMRWLGTCTDIHERKLAEIRLRENEGALREREKQLSMIFGAGTMGDWTWDIATDEVHAHPTVWALYGAPGLQGSVPASWFAERQHPGDRERIERELRAALENDEALDIEFRVVHTDGSERWISLRGVVVRDERGTAIQTHGINIDITERKIAELRVQESERQLRAQADAMPHVVWTAKRDGSIDYYNQRWYEYTGVTGDPWEWRQFIHPDDLDACVDTYSKGIEAGKAFEVVFRLRRASDGSYRWHRARNIPFRDERGFLLYWFGTSTDIHEQKTENARLEAEVQARTEELRRSLMEIEALLKEVHHRVKNNLQVISSLLWMQSETIDNEVAVAALKQSQQRVFSMALIHQRLYGNGQMDEIDFGEYTQALVNELFYGYAGDAGTLSTRLNVESVKLKIDQAIPCGLILNELVTNALKYAYPNGRSGEIWVDLAATESGEVTLRVSDRGVGLPQTLDWKTSNSLGLPIVDLLANQVGGNLTVQRQPGAAFTVTFPREGAPAARVASAA